MSKMSFPTFLRRLAPPAVDKLYALSPPTRTLRALSFFTEMMIAILLPFVLVLTTLELLDGRSETQVGTIRFWLGALIALVPFHIVALDQLLLRPARLSAPEQISLKMGYAIIFAGGMVVASGIIVLSPLLLELPHIIADGEANVIWLLGYFTILLAHQSILHLAWMTLPQLDRIRKTPEAGATI